MNADQFSITADRLLLFRTHHSCAPVSRPPLHILNKYFFNRQTLPPLPPQPTTVADVKQMFLYTARCCRLCRISRPPLQMLNKYFVNRPPLPPLPPQPTTIADVKQIFL